VLGLGGEMKSQQMMHAAVLHRLGETPRYEPFPAPLAGGGEAVVTVTAAALKPSDRWMANGQTVLVLGATGASGRIATQLATRRGARVVADGEISLDIDPEPLASVEQVWPQAGSHRRIVFVP
jgi:D-arabinose 1-dehydrogenase-like Zn-dependent alcohol dehydrogenase